MQKIKTFQAFNRNDKKKIIIFVSNYGGKVSFPCENCRTQEGKVPYFDQGEMLEWLKRHAWKACKRQKRFGGSNPPLSAMAILPQHDKKEIK